jgi:hypothetical protein
LRLGGVLGFKYELAGKTHVQQIRRGIEHRSATGRRQAFERQGGKVGWLCHLGALVTTQNIDTLTKCRRTSICNAGKTAAVAQQARQSVRDYLGADLYSMLIRPRDIPRRRSIMSSTLASPVTAPEPTPEGDAPVVSSPVPAASSPRKEVPYTTEDQANKQTLAEALADAPTMDRYETWLSYTAKIQGYCRKDLIRANGHTLQFGLQLLARPEYPSKRDGRMAWQQALVPELRIKARQLQTILSAAESLRKVIDKGRDTQVGAGILCRPLGDLPRAFKNLLAGRDPDEDAQRVPKAPKRTLKQSLAHSQRFLESLAGLTEDDRLEAVHAHMAAFNDLVPDDTAVNTPAPMPAEVRTGRRLKPQTKDNAAPGLRNDLAKAAG